MNLCVVGLHFKSWRYFNVGLLQSNIISTFYKPQTEHYQFYRVGKIQATVIIFFRTVDGYVTLGKIRNGDVPNTLSNCKNTQLEGSG
jgi:hypothetical protein